MRGSLALFKHQYYRPKYCFTDKEHEVRFKTRTPMKVGNSVSTSIVRGSKHECLQEMFNVMACLKENEFEEANCSKEIRLFNECSGNQRPVEFRVFSKREQKALRSQAQVGQNQMSTVQLNDYLKKFPT